MLMSTDAKIIENSNHDWEEFTHISKEVSFGKHYVVVAVAAVVVVSVAVFVVVVVVESYKQSQTSIFLLTKVFNEFSCTVF